MPSKYAQPAYNHTDPNVRREFERRMVSEPVVAPEIPKPAPQIIPKPKSITVDSPDETIMVEEDGNDYHLRFFNYTAGFEQYGWIDLTTDETTIVAISSGNPRQIPVSTLPGEAWMGFYCPNEVVKDEQGWFKHTDVTVKHNVYSARKLTYFEPKKSGVYHIDLGLMVKISRNDSDCSESDYKDSVPTEYHSHIESIMLGIVVLSTSKLQSIIDQTLDLSGTINTEFAFRALYNERINKTFQVTGDTVVGTGITALNSVDVIRRCNRREFLTGGREIYIAKGEVAIPVWKIVKAKEMRQYTTTKTYLENTAITSTYLCQLYETFHVRHKDNRKIGTSTANVGSRLLGVGAIDRAIIHKLI